jgi:glyoxylase-like metal-dependent hydrolase (beta-lactamase superfamily II)
VVSARLDQLSDHLYRYQDWCTVYVIAQDGFGLLVDSGSGRVRSSLSQAGISSLEWVLHTHHHRDQSWGAKHLSSCGARIAAPSHEAYLFRDAELFWQTRRIYDNYDNRNTFLTLPWDVPVDLELADYEIFSWRGTDLEVLPAKGHTMGSIALLSDLDHRRVAFVGDLMTDGGRLYQLHAMEYTYGSLEGIVFTLQSLQKLRKWAPDLVLPSHGDPITDPDTAIDQLEERLMQCVGLGRGMFVGSSNLAAVEGERPREEAYLPRPHLVELSEHLLWGGEWTCSNFYALLNGRGAALLVDYGHGFWSHLHTLSDHGPFETTRFVEHSLDELRDSYAVEHIDVVIPTHIHDDHTCGIPFLKRFQGTQCWALDKVAEVLADPAAWASLPCIHPTPIASERVLADGERFEWEGIDFAIHHAPGQTEFHAVLTATVDGLTVAFTGDNYFLADRSLGGATVTRPYLPTVMRNSFQLKMHRRCAELMVGICPDLVCPGHGPVLPCSPRDVADYAAFVSAKERVFRQLVKEPSDHYIDLFWVRLRPYLVDVSPRDQVEYAVLLRNNLERAVSYSVEFRMPPGWKGVSEPSNLLLAPSARGELRVAVEAPPEGDGRRRAITAEVFMDGQSVGPLAEALVTVRG